MTEIPESGVVPALWAYQPLHCPFCGKDMQSLNTTNVQVNRNRAWHCLNCDTFVHRAYTAQKSMPAPDLTHVSDIKLPPVVPNAPLPPGGYRGSPTLVDPPTPLKTE